MRHLSAKILKTGCLSSKETEVLRYLCEGYYRPEIALKLHRSLSTVSSHIEHISDKLQARGSTEIVVIAQKLGLVEITLTHQRHVYRDFLLVIICIMQLFADRGRRPPRPPNVRVVRIRSEYV